MQKKKKNGLFSVDSLSIVCNNEKKKKNGLFYVDLRAYLLSKRNNANETTKEL